MPPAKRRELVPDMAAVVEKCVRQAKALDIADQVKFAASLYSLAGMALFAAARLFAEARDRTTSSGFLSAVDQAHMPRETTDRLIGLHERFKTLPIVQSLAHVGLAKLEVIARLEDDEIQCLAKGEEARGISLERLEQASNKQLELDLFASQSAGEQEASVWKRRYERQARENRELKDQDFEKEFQRRVMEALTQIQTGVTDLVKLVREAQRDAKGARQLNGSVELLSGTVKRAGTLMQHKFGRAKNDLAKLEKNSIQ